LQTFGSFFLILLLPKDLLSEIFTLFSETKIKRHCTLEFDALVRQEAAARNGHLEFVNG
jgi:hypothetical protein